MMIKLLTLSFFLMSTSTSYGSPPSVDDYLKHDKNELHDMYIYGLESGLEWAQEHVYTKNSIEFFCKPGDLVLSSSQLRSLINKEIQENNSFYNKYKDAPLLGLALRNAYIENFPCQ
tara:strand:- start:517 stop:867 length:351 start_codon:yes stop_codon:yes gene_type:complete